jgi:hypothetical protein
MEAQAQLMQVVTQFIANSQNNNNNPPPPPPPPQVDMLARFLRLRPAKFSHAAKPLEAMDWLRSVNKDLVTVGCTDAKKVRFAAHLLEGPAENWWDTYQITHPIDGVTWDSFQEGFRAAHISYGVMGLKKKEFRDLKQRYHNVSKYIDEFINLSRYAPDDVDTDAKRKEKFLEGLNDELSIPLSLAYAPPFQALLDQAIILENKMKKSKGRKRKHNHGTSYSGQYQNPHSSYEGHGGSKNRHGGSDHHKNGGSGHHHRKGNDHHHNGHRHQDHHGFNNKGHGDNNGEKPKKDLAQVTCFKCHNTGHYAYDCLEKKPRDTK